jgi:hypothetical protein
MEAAGIEPASRSPEVSSSKAVAQTPSETLAQTLARETQADPDLARIVGAWPMLPDALRAGIVAVVQAASKGQ